MKLTEFDEEKTAVVNAWDFYSENPDCPGIAVTCFAENLIEYAVKEFSGRKIGQCSCANGIIPFYEITYKDRKIGLIMSLIGAPAAVGEYEELFAMGVEKLLVFGTCGVLDRSISDCSVIIPNSAVRDEGTSYHYLPESDEIEVNTELFAKMTDFFNSRNIKYTVGKVWTTDAFYRETKNKVARRRKEGCICVDMECSAIAALAGFRNKQAAQFFYSADNLDGEKYEIRSLSNGSKTDVKRKILELALEAATEIF